MQNVGGVSLLVPLGSRVLDLNGVITLNATGCCVWEQLAEDRSVDELAAAIVERFEVDFDRARSELKIFLDEMARLGLVE